jgi:hypothetical protein
MSNKECPMSREGFALGIRGSLKTFYLIEMLSPTTTWTLEIPCWILDISLDIGY